VSARPRLHLTPEGGWLNDPHGITWHEGRYHLFHQYVPGRTTWGPNCHWAHVTSPDLLGDWVDEGIALAPGEGDDGIWTGSLVQDSAGRARIFYTSTVAPDIGMGFIRVAEPVDSSWREWRKGDIVIEPPRDLDLIAYRDPFVQREVDGWVMHVGAGTSAGRALALRYRSDDLESWTFEGSTLERSTSERDPVWMGALWECPQVVEVDGRDVMISSIWEDDVLHYAGAAVGGMVADQLNVQTWQRVSYGDSYYAPSFFRDRDGRPCVMFWMRGLGGADAGWASALSIPHVLSVAEGRLHLSPHPDLAARLEAEPERDATSGVLTRSLQWSPNSGDRLELRDASGVVTTSVRAADTALLLERSGLEAQSMPFSGGDVVLLVDGPAIEIWADGCILGGAIEPAAEIVEVPASADPSGAVREPSAAEA